MRIAIFGGTGYVGIHLVHQLTSRGHRPVLLVRPGSTQRANDAPGCDIVTGDVGDTAAVEETLRGVDAAIFNIGILREFPARDITFEGLQYEAAARVIDAAARLDVRRFLLMSANGVDAGETPYQQTKRRAEEHLAASGLDWTIFRPSVIFGDPQGRMEFASQLLRDIVRSPLPAPLFFPGLTPAGAGGFELSPVHVDNVAEAFARSLEWPTTIGQIIELGGPESLTWREILQRIAKAVGRRKLMLPVPALGVTTAATLFDRFEAFPITRDQITMLLAGNSCSSAALGRLGIEPIPFTAETLAYLRHDSSGTGPCHRNAA
jgi:NADH dehydrogenase